MIVTYYHIILIILIFYVIYISLKGTDTDPEGMIFQSFMFPFSVFLWVLFLSKYYYKYSWILSLIIGIIGSNLVNLGVYAIAKYSKKFSYFILNLATSPFWLSMDLFGKNKITEYIAGVIMSIGMLYNKIYTIG